MLTAECPYAQAPRVVMPGRMRNRNSKTSGNGLLGRAAFQHFQSIMQKPESETAFEAVRTGKAGRSLTTTNCNYRAKAETAPPAPIPPSGCNESCRPCE